MIMMETANTIAKTNICRVLEWHGCFSKLSYRTVRVLLFCKLCLKQFTCAERSLSVLLLKMEKIISALFYKRCS